MQEHKYYGNLFMCRSMLLTVTDAITGILNCLDGPPDMAIQFASEHLLNVRDVLDLIVRLTLEIQPSHD